MGTTDREVAARRLIDLEQGRRRKASTVAEMYEHYLTERGAQIAGKETLRFAWKLLEPVFGHLRPDQITRALTRSHAANERNSARCTWPRARSRWRRLLSSSATAAKA